MKFDYYDLVARAFPAFLSSVPFFIFHYFFLRPAIGEFWGQLLGLTIILDITFVSVLLFLLMQVTRIISKEVFEKTLYKDGLYFPTTNFLLHANSYFSAEYTNKIHQKVKSNFDISIPTYKEELVNEDLSRRHVNEAMTHIRAVVGKGRLVRNHNIEYGFIRNLSGGCLIAVVMSFINIIVFGFLYQNPAACNISIATFLIYLTLALFSKIMINSVGKSYAKVLIQEYMAK